MRTILFAAVALAAFGIWGAPDAEAAPFGSKITSDVYVGFGYGGSYYRRRCYRRYRPVRRRVVYTSYDYYPRRTYYAPRYAYYPRYRSSVSVGFGYGHGHGHYYGGYSRYYGGHHHHYRRSHGHYRGHRHSGSRRAYGRRR